MPKEVEWETYYYHDGTLECEIPLVNGLRHGTVREYHIDGTLRREATYANGKKSGIERWYYLDGTLENEVIYIDDTRYITKWHNSNGTLAEERYYIAGRERSNLSKLEKLVLFGQET